MPHHGTRSEALARRDLDSRHVGVPGADPGVLHHHPVAVAAVVAGGNHRTGPGQMDRGAATSTDVRPVVEFQNPGDRVHPHPERAGDGTGHRQGAGRGHRARDLGGWKPGDGRRGCAVRQQPDGWGFQVEHRVVVDRAVGQAPVQAVPGIAVWRPRQVPDHLTRPDLGAFGQRPGDGGVGGAQPVAVIDGNRGAARDLPVEIDRPDRRGTHLRPLVGGQVHTAVPGGVKGGSAVEGTQQRPRHGGRENQPRIRVRHCGEQDQGQKGQW